MADTGATGGGTAANDASFGDFSWSSVSEALSDNSGYALSSCNSSQSTNYLKVTNFGFSIPSGATIDGILVSWNCRDFSGGVRDSRIRIVKGGTVGSTDKSSATAWSSGGAYRDYGGASDLWGETWTDTDINASTFGAVLSAKSSSGGENPAVMYMRITVYYTTGAAGQPTMRRFSQTRGFRPVEIGHEGVTIA